ncbi:hypothetical protein CEXT_132841 [Caerostris extrusa]|uniref:Uncharacterized protein n=1 Tax=Caerostris extrusa TaxID=172846 RepID=A0AAV4RWM2_CAEEX|nr:hypothetical protein CEXT_132841 [Caerostris extrusa]
MLSPKSNQKNAKALITMPTLIRICTFNEKVNLLNRRRKTRLRGRRKSNPESDNNERSKINVQKRKSCFLRAYDDTDWTNDIIILVEISSKSVLTQFREAQRNKAASQLSATESECISATNVS